jgi:thiamine biosynthesis lipoprotein ApbE
MQKHEIQRRRLIAKEERNRLAQFQKIQEKQIQAQIQQQQQQQQMVSKNSAISAANTNTNTKHIEQQSTTA